MSAVARWFRVDVRTVQNWKNNGMPCGEKLYDLQAITSWLRERSDRPAAAIDMDTEREEFLKLKAERETKEARLAAFVGKLIEKGVVLSLLQQFAAIVRSRLQSIPGELASSIPPEHRHDLMIELEQKIGLILTEMASWVLPASLRMKTKSSPVNGVIKPPTSRKYGKKSAKSSRRKRSR